jgi:uncharacterized protein (DUF2342 family)
MSSPSTASLFAENRDEVMTPILPANMNGPTQDVSVAVQAEGPSPQDKQRLADDAIGVHQNIQEQGQSVNVKQSDAMYLTSQVGQAVSKVSTGVLGILSDEHASNQKDGLDRDEPEQQAPVARAPVQQFMPSVTSGPGMG